MDPSVTAVLERCLHDAHAGAIGFDMVVERLAGIGVEAYLADFRASTTTFYLPDGQAHALPLQAPQVAISDTFDPQVLQAVIHGAQQGEVKYPEFLARAMGAGCVGYIVWIAGQHVSYFGRRGECHVEPFPRTV
jgi:uncharacterized protein YbcV (DUF1398 family)